MSTASPSSPDAGRVAAIVLAAGASRRLGQPKQLLRTPTGETLLHRTVRLAQEAGCAPVVVVTGALDAKLRAAVADLHPLLMHCANWAAGMGATLKTGLAALEATPPAGFVVLTTDQPGLTAPYVKELLVHFRATGAAAIATAYDATARGIPVCFAWRLVPLLRALPDEQGAKPLLRQLGSQVEVLPFPAAALDLDTPEQVRAWQAGSPSQFPDEPFL